MDNPKQNPLRAMIAALMLAVATAGLLFFLMLVAGINIAADPGNMDTGMAAVLCTPFYLLAAVLAGVVVFFLMLYCLSRRR